MNAALRLGSQPLDRSYRGDLERWGFKPECRGIWLKNSRTTLVQGWKIHVSAIPMSAPDLMDRLLPILRAESVPFKIARDATTLGLLNEGAFGATQVGKFCTIYPESDAAAVRLAAQLVAATSSFDGPVIPSDLHLGNVIYTRYGGFDSIARRDLLGQVHLYIKDNEGQLVPDLYTQPFVPPEFASCPFESIDGVSPDQTARVTALSGRTKSAIFGPCYVLVDTIKRHPKGNVYLALNVRSRETVAGRVIKQGRRQCLSDIHGRDIRVRLQRQGNIHEQICSQVPVPGCDPYFEVDGDGYLPLEHLSGADLETVVRSTLDRRPWALLERANKLRMIDHLRQLVDAVERLHRTGFVHRDLSASNVWVCDDERVRLLDLEIAHHVEDPSPVFGKGTPGFMAPEQEAGARPHFGQDVHAVAALILFALTGIDPRRTLFAQHTSRARNVRHLAESVPNRVLNILLQGVSNDPCSRPALSEVQREIAAYERRLSSHRCSAERRQRIRSRNFSTLVPSVRSAARGAALGLIRHSIKDGGSGMWLSAAISNSAGNHEQPSSYELRRSANRGVAGVVYSIAKLARCGVPVEEAVPCVRAAVDWLLSDAATPDCGMPGLHFGNAGVALSIAEAVASGLIDRTERMEIWIRQALDAQTLWPDITHGVAGQGIAAIRCAHILEDDAPLRAARRCALYLMDSQELDGSWKMPDGVPGMSGETLTGFAHGVAGIVFFLLEYGHRFADRKIIRGAEKGLDWLIQQAIPTSDASEKTKTSAALRWRYSDRHDTVWNWWCHGAPGIALAFLQAHRLTRCPHAVSVARRALAEIDPNARSANLSTCHGLGGLGEILIEAGRVLHDRRYTHRALLLADTIVHLGHRCEDGAMLWLAEDPIAPTADLMVGMGGIAHFLARLSSQSTEASFPLLL